MVAGEYGSTAQGGFGSTILGGSEPAVIGGVGSTIGRSEPSYKKLAPNVDTDGDGNLNIDEALGFYVPILIGMVTNMTEIWDTNRNGYLEYLELLATGENVDGAKLAGMDRNKDKRISIDEMLRVWRNMAHSAILDKFYELDIKEDGYLEPNELAGKEPKFDLRTPMEIPSIFEM